MFTNIEILKISAVCLIPFTLFYIYWVLQGITAYYNLTAHFTHFFQNITFFVNIVNTS